MVTRAIPKTRASSARAAAVGLAAVAVLFACAMPLAVHGRRAEGARPRPSPPAVTPVFPRRIAIVMGAGESLEAALLRGGLSRQDARDAAAALGEDFDVVNPHPGLAVDLAVSPGARPPGLIGLSLRPSEEAGLALRRGADGALRVERIDPPAAPAPTSAGGVVEGSLYLSMVGAGVTPPMASTVADLFGRRLDLARDVESGDRFRLVFGDGGAPDLLYAEVAARGGVSRLYRFEPGGSAAIQFVDGETGPVQALLLRTPVDGARITSAFGPRLHPLLGFTRMHQGIDFGAAAGAPVFAAGDGVVEEARWSGGYGRWLKIRHARSLETGYAHLSAWAPGIAPGVGVHQGQVVAFVGATGLATGPHLHYEVFARGGHIDPRLARGAAGQAPDRSVQAAFRAQKARIDARVGEVS